MTLIPPAWIQSPQDPALSLAGELAFTRGGILLIDAPPSWLEALRRPRLKARLEGVLVRAIPQHGPGARQLGLAGPGVYMVDRAGQVKFHTRSDPDEGVEGVMDQMGWSSKASLYRRFIELHPERLDVHWALLEVCLEDLQANPEEDAVRAAADQVARLLEQRGWASVPNTYREPPKPSKGVPENNPLASMARSRWGEVEAEIRRTPGHAAAWRMAELLASWDPGHPRLHRLIEGLEPAPGIEGPEAAAWPSSLALRLATQQLRELNDWRGLAEFSRQRIDRLDELLGAVHPEALNEWSGVLITVDGKLRRPTRRELQSETYGIWLGLAFEASLREGREGEAGRWADRLLREGDAQSQKRAEGLASALQFPGLAAKLKANRR